MRDDDDDDDDGFFLIYVVVVALLLLLLLSLLVLLFGVDIDFGVDDEDWGRAGEDIKSMFFSAVDFDDGL